MTRQTNDELFMDTAKLIAGRGTCPRRAVGCVLTGHKGEVLATGYNGAPAGQEHCTERPCPGAGLPSGQGLDLCRAVHAEQNAVVRLRDPYAVHTAYITVTPCMACIKLLFTTSCRRIVVGGLYPHEDAIAWWEAEGGEFVYLQEGDYNSLLSVT